MPHMWAHATALFQCQPPLPRGPASEHAPCPLPPTHPMPQPTQCCVNCGVAGLPANCYRHHPLHGTYCCACFTYSSTHGGKARPEQLWQRQRHRMLETLDPNALRCTHCGRLPKRAEGRGGRAQPEVCKPACLLAVVLWTCAACAVSDGTAPALLSMHNPPTAEGELFHKCRHPRNGRPLCGTCHHYAWRKDGQMRPWELVARDPHMRDASGRPAQQAFRSRRPGTAPAAPVAASAAAAGRQQEEAAAAAGGGGHRARRGRPVREMSEAEQAAWHAAWQLPSGYLPAGAVPPERRAAGRLQAAAGGEADQQQEQEQARRQQWQQLVAWDGEGEAGQQLAQQQQEGTLRVRHEGEDGSAGRAAAFAAALYCSCSRRKEQRRAEHSMPVGVSGSFNAQLRASLTIPPCCTCRADHLLCTPC